MGGDRQLAAELQRQAVRLVLAGEIGQVRDMLAAVSDPGGTPEYHRTCTRPLPQPRPSWRGRLLMINRSPRRSDG